MASKLFRGLVFLLLLSVFPSWATAPAAAVVATPPQPAWNALTVEQRTILAPLAREWDRMENYRRKKWLGIAERYPRMRPEAQQRLVRRMQQWAAMTPQQRTKVRRDYRDFSKLPPARKAAIRKKWQDYSRMSVQERKKPGNDRQPVRQNEQKPAGVPVVNQGISEQKVSR